MIGQLKKIFGLGKDSNKRAKSRLHFVLVQDRAGLSGDEMADFKKELMEVVEKYFVVDKQGFDVSYEREQDQTVLLINSPVIVKRQESLDKEVGSKRNNKNKKQKKKAAVALDNRGRKSTFSAKRARLCAVISNSNFE